MKQPLKVKPPIRLKDFDPAFHGDFEKEDIRKKTRKLQKRVGDLQKLLYANARQTVLVLFQGMDTSGKDGSTRNLLEYVNPAGVETSNFKAPSARELAHDFLWRIHQAVPRYGNIGVFNRSQYEDVLIVRVLNLRPRKIWEARFDQINAFEKHLTENNVILLKFFLHISKEEQIERLQARIDNPRKNWKFDVGDLKMRAKWNEFQKAYEDVLNRCSTPWAPWHIVPADRKWYRDHVVASVVNDALEALHLGWPDPVEDLSKIRIR